MKSYDQRGNRDEKRIFATLLTAGLTTGMLPAASAAVDSGDADAYLKAMDNMPSASSYLVDFDGDGTDELLLVQKNTPDQLRYEVWDGSARLANAKVEYLSLELDQKAGTNQQYLVTTPKYGDAIGRTSYTISSGAWKKAEELSGAWIGMQQKCYINGVPVTAEEFAQAEKAYTTLRMLDTDQNSVREEVLTALDVTVDGYKDVLSTLSSSERQALFHDLLYCVAGVDTGYIMPGRPSRGFDSRTASDEEIVALLESLRMDTYFEISNDPFPQADFTKLTQQYFGRTIDYSRFATDHQPTEMDYGYSNLYYDGVFYLCWPQRGSNIELESLSGTPKQLYSWAATGIVRTFRLPRPRLRMPILLWLSKTPTALGSWCVCIPHMTPPQKQNLLPLSRRAAGHRRKSMQPTLRA